MITLTKVGKPEDDPVACPAPVEGARKLSLFIRERHKCERERMGEAAPSPHQSVAATIAPAVCLW